MAVHQMSLAWRGTRLLVIASSHVMEERIHAHAHVLPSPYTLPLASTLFAFAPDVIQGVLVASCSWLE